MSLGTKTKDPDAVLDYKIDWSTWLGADTIATSSWELPPGITKDSDSNTTTDTTIWVSGGNKGQKYTVVNRIATTAGRTDDRSFVLSVSEK